MKPLADLIQELALPYPARYVKQVQGNDYVPHHIVTQRLIHILGYPPKTEVLREIYDDGSLSGVVMRMTVEGYPELYAEEIGASDNPQSKSNGDRGKDACSDAYKRCAMRLSNGLFLWAQGDYFLYDKLKMREPVAPDS